MPKSTRRASSATAPRGSVAEAIHTARRAGIAWADDAGRGSVPIREVARRSGVSPAQISRIESGEVRRPGREILLAIARGLNRNPMPLLLLGGHLAADEGREHLAALFRDGAELPEEWGDVPIPLDRVRQILADPEADEAELRVIASEVFAVAETEETLWQESHQALLARGEHSADLRRLLDCWNYISPDRRRRVLAYARELRDLTDLEYRINHLT